VTEKEFKANTKALALKIITFCGEIPEKWSATSLPGRSLARRPVSVAGAGACQAIAQERRLISPGLSGNGSAGRRPERPRWSRSYWLELLSEQKTVNKKAVMALIKQTESILRITVASIRTLKRSKT